MNDQIRITEEDIFNYVLHPDVLAEEKKFYIEANENQFVDGINYYKSFSFQLNSPEAEELTKKIGSRLLEDNVVILRPTFNPTQLNGTGLKLAAASATLQKKTDSISFADDKSNYLVRVVKSEDKTLLYVFSNDPNSKYEVKLQPGGNSYHIRDCTKPIEIFAEEEIKEIVISSIK